MEKTLEDVEDMLLAAMEVAIEGNDDYEDVKVSPLKERTEAPNDYGLYIDWNGARFHIIIDSEV